MASSLILISVSKMLALSNATNKKEQISSERNMWSAQIIVPCSINVCGVCVCVCVCVRERERESFVLNNYCHSIIIVIIYFTSCQ